MYLETVYVLSQKMPVVRSVDIAEYMGYSKPSVSRAVGLLKKRALIETDKSGKISLTTEGKKLGKSIYERHTVLSQMFMMLGVDEKTATEDACRVEHYISEKTFKAVKKHLKQYSEEK